MTPAQIAEIEPLDPTQAARLRVALRSGEAAAMQTWLAATPTPEACLRLDPDQLIKVAFQAPCGDAWTLLCERVPQLVPSQTRAWSYLGDVLRDHPLWMADWLLAHTDVAQAHREMDQKRLTPNTFLFNRAFARADEAGLVWLTQPFETFPRWEDSSSLPALWEALRTQKPRDAVWAKKVAHLLSHGAQWSLQADPLTYGQISPLGHLVRYYDQALSPTKAEFEPLLQQLWPLLIAAGDSLDQPLGKETVEAVILRTPMADWVNGWKRSQMRLESLESKSAAPSPSRSRLRS